jgi:hypothetical protein
LHIKEELHSSASSSKQLSILHAVYPSIQKGRRSTTDH